MQVWKYSSLEAGNKKGRAHVPSQELQGTEPSNRVNVGRRFFISGLDKAAAEQSKRPQSSESLTKSDADPLRFAAWAEIVESDLWTQNSELAEPQNPMTAHPTSEILPTNSARQYLDGAMPQNVTDNDDDQLSHAAFLNAYLRPHGAGPVNLDAFRHLMGKYRGGADKNKISKWFTNFLNLNVDLS